MHICFHCRVTLYETMGVNFTGSTNLNSHEKWLPGTWLRCSESLQTPSLLAEALFLVFCRQRTPGKEPLLAGNQTPVDNLWYDSRTLCRNWFTTPASAEHCSAPSPPPPPTKKDRNMYINLWSPLLMTKSSLRARQPLSRVNLTGFFQVKIENIYLFIKRKHL